MSFGVWQIALILVIVLIIFGAGKLPRVMGEMGKGIKSFKSGMNDKDEDTASSAKTIENNMSSTMSSESTDKDSMKS